MTHRLNADLNSCFEIQKILRWDNVERYLNNNNLWHNPDILEMFSNNDVEFHNDSYAKIYRHWIKNDDDLRLFDLICEVFEIEHEIATYGKKEDTTKLVFWISW